MARSLLLAVCCLLVLAIAPVAHAAEEAEAQGAGFSQLATRALPAPSSLSVTVLPFALSSASTMPASQAQRQAEMPRVCVLLNLQRHGFKIVPKAESLSLVPASTDRATGLEPVGKVPPEWDRERAVEAGKKTGADWVMYGDVALQFDYRTAGQILAKPKKVVRLNLRLVLVDVESGQVLFWKRVEETAQGSSTVHGFQPNAEDSKIARGLLLRVTGDLLDTISKALPKHAVSAAVTSKQLEDVVGAMGL